MMRTNLRLFLKNKKAEEKVFSIWWFLSLGIIGAGIVGGIYIFYAADVDVQQIEADILYERIANCVIDNGFIGSTLRQKDFDIYEECYLSEELFNETNSFSFRIDVFDEGNKVMGEKIQGGIPFDTECDLVIGNPREDEKPELDEYPKCVRKKEHAFYWEDGVIKKVTIEILAVSNNQPGEVSL